MPNTHTRGPATLGNKFKKKAVPTPQPRCCCQHSLLQGLIATMASPVLLTLSIQSTSEPVVVQRDGYAAAKQARAAAGAASAHNEAALLLNNVRVLNAVAATTSEPTDVLVQAGRVGWHYGPIQLHNAARFHAIARARVGC